MKYLSIVLLLFVSACTEYPTGLEPDQPAAAEVYVKGDYVHEASGMEFPVKVDSFKRTNLFRYDKGLRNFSAEYQLRNLLGRAAVVKVYIYPASIVSRGDQPDLKGHFREVKASLLDIYPDANDVAEGTIKIGQDWGGERGLAFSFKHKSDKLFKKKLCLSHTYLFLHGPWYIKYRVTYPAKEQEKTDAKVGHFMHLLNWPSLEKETN